MTRVELLELIANGESSGVEFKRDDLRPEQIAREVVGLANFRGGRILLGVETTGRSAAYAGTIWSTGSWTPCSAARCIH